MLKFNSRKITTPQSLNAYIKGIYDIMQGSNYARTLRMRFLLNDSELLFNKEGRYLTGVK